MNLKAQAASGVKWTALSSAATTGGQFIQLAVLARLLGPEDFGLMSMVMIVISFAQTYADVGVSAAIIHRQDVTASQLSSLYWLNHLAGIVLFIVMQAMTPFVVMFYHESQLALLLRVLSFSLLIAPIGLQFGLLLQKELHFHLLAKFHIVTVVIGTSISIVLAALNYGVWALVWGSLSQQAAQALMLLVVGLRRYHLTCHFQADDLRGYLSFGLYQIGERSINFLAERLDQLLIGSLLGAQALGYYNFAFRLVAQPINRINPIVTNVVFPVFAKVQDETPRLKRGYLKVISLLTTVNAPLLVGLTVVAPQVIPLVFGAQWTESVVIVQILAWVTLSRSTGNPLGSLLLAKGRADLGFRWNVLLFCLSIPVVYLGAVFGKAVGVAVSLLALQLLLIVPGYIYLLRPLIGACAAAYALAVLKPIGFALMMGMGVVLLGFLIPQGWYGLVLQISIGGLLYCCLLWAGNRPQLLELRQVFLENL